ncbi:MAG: ribonuclease HII [Campylobacter sp.]|nr:ribonuclease HII [Campylobacter sp.]
MFENQICGIDEAGRGALAGPMSIAACVLSKDIPGLMDSKMLSPAKREKLYKQIVPNSKFLIIYFSNKQIDTLGLSECLRRALECFKRYFDKYDLIFDGKASYGTDVKTLIKADSKIAQVSAASILAKVSRDKLMIAFDKLYPAYGYAIHKGYGTKQHLEALKNYGKSPLSRNSFKIKNNLTF